MQILSQSFETPISTQAGVANATTRTSGIIWRRRNEGTHTNDATDWEAFRSGLLPVHAYREGILNIDMALGSVSPLCPAVHRMNSITCSKRPEFRLEGARKTHVHLHRPTGWLNNVDADVLNHESFGRQHSLPPEHLGRAPRSKHLPRDVFTTNIT